IQRHTVQCVLVINIFIEKIFIMLWMWYTLLAIATILSLLFWLGSAVMQSRRYRFVSRNLEIADVEFDLDFYHEEVDMFVRDWIKTDGVFVLRMITIHNGTMFAMELIHSMWSQFLEEKQGHGQAAFLSLEEKQGHGQAAFLSSPGSAVIRGLDEVDETRKEKKSKHSDEEDEEEERGNSVAPLPVSPIQASRPKLERRQSVYIPLLLPHSDRRQLPQTNRQSRKKFSRSSSMYR
ncbi:MAG: hypothetical protein GY696_16285, partial [Gammaproteobacteria bacterium]|nr:hypothetical protein [Gammaproteobacteria bacterium]